MVEKIPANTGSITIGKFELKYQIEGFLEPTLFMGSNQTLFHRFNYSLFEKSDHTLQYEEPELFDQELLQWLNSHSK